MDRVLLIEASATRRRALASLLAQRGFEITPMAGYGDGSSVLAGIDRAHFQAVIASWPDYSDHRAEEAFALLRSREWSEMPVLVMADSTEAGAVNWLMKRQATALLLWSDYSDAPDALTKLLRPNKPQDDGAEAVATDQLRVLFVDDSPTVRIAFKRLLTAEGYHVQLANSAEEGLETSLAQDFDIAIVDYFMPGANGAVLVKQLREDPRTSHVLAAIITGTYSDRVITESLSAGAVECMFKSEARELFLARVRSLSRMVLDRKAIDNERRRLQGILSSVGEGVFGVDSQGRIQFINPAALDILGYAGDADLVGESAARRFHYAFEDGTRIPPQACFLSQTYRNGTALTGWQTVFWHESGRPVPIECTVYPLDIEGRREGSVVAFRDVSRRRQLEEELRWAANHDALTKLDNRASFEQQLQQELARLKRSDQSSVLLFVDLDRFKYINDTLGHAAGDQLLVEVSHRLRKRLRVSDTLARMGGDEYALILRNAHQDPALLAEDFRRALTAQLFSFGDSHYRITASIGAAVLDRQVHSLSEAMANADIACHIAKNKGRNQVHVYSRDSDQRASMDIELNWSARIEEALRDDLFTLHFQPVLQLAQINLEELPAAEGELWMRHLASPRPRRVYYEVLLRMRTASGELVAPDAFLPTAERYNMMLDIDRWVIHTALRELREHQARHPQHPMGVSINLSAQSLGANGIGRYVMDKLVEFNIDPNLVTFEITETKAVTNLEAARELITQLRGLGCRFALDDFGCGFSSFTHLKHLDVDFLKIDGSFIQGLLEDPVDRAVIAAINNIAHSVGKRTVAEYVDRPDVLAALHACGVDFVQGYYIGRPVADLAAASVQARAMAERPARLATDG